MGKHNKRMRIIQQPNASNTKAVVIMFGWVGAAPKNVDKYANLYSNHEVHKCAVVHTTAKTIPLLTKNEGYLTSVIMESVKAVMGIVRKVEGREEGGGGNDVNQTDEQQQVPIVLHYFSNGGGYLADQLNSMIRKAIEGKIKDEEDTQDLIAVRDRLSVKGIEILDSTPAYMHDDIGYRVIKQASPPFLVGAFFKGVYFSTLVYYRAKCAILKQEKKEDKYWRDMIHSDLCRRQIFVYSAGDSLLTDPEKLDEFIELLQHYELKYTTDDERLTCAMICAEMDWMDANAQLQQSVNKQHYSNVQQDSPNVAMIT